MRYRPDMLISDRFGTTIAMVEVKALAGTNVLTAARYLRNLLTHGGVPDVRYVLLITGDVGYLWFTPEEVLRQSPPSLAFPMDRIVHHYLPSVGESAPVRDLVLESIVRQWLLDLVDGIEVDHDVATGLRRTGFLNAVRGGRVDIHVAV